jgi:CheY-like chemotaxis protein/anti-sigma regulatory factor (Ser/Thr protein kinase)
MTTILVVDDDAVDREAAERCLDSVDDLRILHAEDGKRALELVAAGPVPDLVLTDLRMPGMDGLQLVAGLQEDYPALPVVLMTSQGSEKIAVQALKAGASSYVPKNELKESLLDTIHQVLEVAESKRLQRRILAYLAVGETRFELVNDPGLIFPLVGYFQDGLARLGFGNESVRTQVGMALMEGLSNAMIHGNLEVGSDLRHTDRERYDALIESRRKESPYADRRVRCTSRISSDRVEYTITDEGPGFDPDTLPDPTAADNVLAVSGRGVWLIRTFMDVVEYNDSGNRLTMVKHNEAPAS